MVGIGSDFKIPLKAIYTWYISGIYCQLGDYMLPTTIYKNLKHRLILRIKFHSQRFKGTAIPAVPEKNTTFCVVTIGIFTNYRSGWSALQCNSLNSITFGGSLTQRPLLCDTMRGSYNWESWPVNIVNQQPRWKKTYARESGFVEI